MVLSPSQVDVAGAYLHPVEQAEGALGASVVRILAEPVAFGVLLTSLLDKMEALQSTVPLE